MASTLHVPPPVNPAFNLSTATSAVTSGAVPKITNTTNSAAVPGAIYAGNTGVANSTDGPASIFLFGATSPYDAQRHFDQQFGMNGNQAFPAFGLATYRFSAITVTGEPSFTANGAALPNIAFVSDSTISEPVGTIPYTWDLNLYKLTSLTFISNGGASLPNATLTAASGSIFKFIQFYERTGSLSFGSVVNAPSAGLFLDTPGNLNITTTASITVDHAVMNAGAVVNFNGAFSGNSLQIFAGGQVQLRKKFAAPTTLFIYAPSLLATQAITGKGGNLEIGTSGISATGLDITGLDNIVSGADISAANLSATNRISAGGMITGNAGTLTISAFSIAAANGMSFVGGDSGAGGNITLQANTLFFDPSAGGINGANVSGGDANLFSLNLVGGDGGTLSLGTAAAPIAGDVVINTPITATSGANALSIVTGGNGGAVNVDTNGTVSVNSTIKVSDSVAPRASRSGGRIAIYSRKSTGTAIQISSSAQLLSLLNGAAPGPGGSIKFTSAGGTINMNGTARADRGTVEIVNNGLGGTVNVTNATLHGDVVKLGALGNNGTLNVGGGTISGDSVIKLYAGGSNGNVNFTDNVTLSGNSMKTIAGDTVTVFNGKTVTVLGNSPASVFTNNPNYTGFGGNGTTSGTFAGQGATTQPLTALPPGW